MKNLLAVMALLLFAAAAVAQGTKPPQQKEKPAMAEAKTKADMKTASAKPAPAAGPSEPGQVIDNALNNLEREFVSAAEAMPDDKFDFKPDPKAGEFAESRSFKQQIGHVAVNNFAMAARLTGEKADISEQDQENGPASLTDKATTIKYLKDSFAAAHKAVATIHKQNMLERLAGGSGPTRLALGNFFVWHGFDHYGQMAIYLRMNGIVPPASRPQPK